MLKLRFHRCKCELDISNPVIPVLIQQGECTDTVLSGHYRPNTGFFSDRDMLTWCYTVDGDGILRVLSHDGHGRTIEVDADTSDVEHLVNEAREGLFTHRRNFFQTPVGKIYQAAAKAVDPQILDTKPVIREIQEYVYSYKLPPHIAPIVSDSLQELISSLDDSTYPQAQPFPVTPTQMG